MKILITSLCYLLLSSSAFGQVSNKVTYLNVKTVSGTERYTRYNAIVPESLDRVFFDYRTFATKEKVVLNQGSLLTSIYKRIRFYSVSRAVLDIHPPRRNRDGTYSAFDVSHPAFYSAVILGRNIYVFYDGDKPDGVDVFNWMTKNLSIKVENADEARQLTYLYLLLYTRRFREPSKIIISRVEDISEKRRAEHPERVAKVKDIIQPLRAVDENGRYKVEFFTWEDYWRGEVLRWQFEVSETGQITLNRELVISI